MLLLFTAKDFKHNAEFFQQFILPLLGEAAGRDDQDAFGVRPHQQFANQQAGHNGFAGTGIIGQHVTQWLAREHGFVDGGYLVRQWLYIRGVDSHHRVKQCRLGYTEGFES